MIPSLPCPYDHLYFPNGGFLMVVLPPGGLFPCMSIRPLSTDEFLQFSFSDEGLYLLFQIVAIRSIMAVIAVEMAILVPGSLGWIAL